MQYTVYHGTNFEFSVFSDIAQNDDLGFFFSDELDDARCYGDRVLICSVRIENPYVLYSSQIYIGVNEICEEKSPWSIGRDTLLSLGYDGVIIIGSESEHLKTEEYESLYTQYIAFSENQIEVVGCV